MSLPEGFHQQYVSLPEGFQFDIITNMSSCAIMMSTVPSYTLLVQATIAKADRQWTWSYISVDLFLFFYFSFDANARFEHEFSHFFSPNHVLLSAILEHCMSFCPLAQRERFLIINLYLILSLLIHRSMCFGLFFNRTLLKGGCAL